MSVTVTIGRPGQFAEFERFARDSFEQAALRASSRAAGRATTEVRAAMRSAGLGRLTNAIGTGSDLSKTGRAHPHASGFSASGWIHIRGHSERTIGALASATEGSTIIPRRGQWLAIATDRIPQRAGRFKMTPALYKSTGLEARIGKLEFIPGRKSGEALLIVRNVSIDRFGRRGRSARALTARKLHSSREARSFIVAFVLLRQTARAARVDPASIIAANAARVPALFGEELRQVTGRAR